MKKYICEFVILLLIFAVSVSVLAGCENKAPSLLITKESETKEQYDEESLRAEFERTSVPEEITEAEESETETESQTEETSEAETSATEKESQSTESETEQSETAQSESETQTEAPTVTLTRRTVVDTKIDTKETTSDYKYGVKKTDVVSTYYDIYSDGSTVQTDQKRYSKYDYSGFKASTNDLLPEAKTNKLTYSSQISSAVAAINELRRSEGKDALVIDDSLCTAACVRATEMAYSGKVGSARPSGSSYSTVLTDLGYSFSKPWELTCKGYKDSSSAVGAIKSSSANYSGITDANHKKIGVGVAADPEGNLYWSFIFAD